LSQEAKSQYQTGKEVTAPRGNILAKDNSFLAARKDAWLVFASIPEIKKTPKEIANKLAPLLVDNPEDIENLLLKEGLVWVPLKDKVSTEVKKNIESLGIVGVGFEKKDTRYYPEASSAAHLLGFVGKNHEGEDTGYFGLEGFYNMILSGKAGFLTSEKDAQGLPILLGKTKEVSAISGVDLLTNIDKTIQMALEKKLLEGIEKYGAKEGTAIVMDPASGAVLGMSSYPSYEPEKYFDYGDLYFKNPAISDTFEPGSVFKILVMAVALDAGAVKPETICDICSGPFEVDKYLIETWDKKYFPDSNMTEVIVHSDNVGMVFVGQKLGKEKLYDYLRKFGLNEISGIDLQGEAAAPLRRKNDWSVVDLATASFGQGIAITPIQMIRAASAIANGGRMPTPHVVGKLKGEGWEESLEVKNKEVISEETARQVTAMMCEAAKRGEAKWTNARGFQVAGKTGTAQIPIAGHYDKEKTIASFVGFAPADNPKFIMLVTLREPSSSPWASETAAPLWYSIAKDLFLYFGIQPEN